MVILGIGHQNDGWHHGLGLILLQRISANPIVDHANLFSVLTG